MYAHKDDQVIMMCFPKLQFLESRGLPEPSGRDVKKLWTVLETVTGFLSLWGTGRKMLTSCLVNVTVGGSGRKSFQYWVPRLGVTSGPGYRGDLYPPYCPDLQYHDPHLGWLGVLEGESGL